MKTRFSLRTLLVVLTLIATGCGIVSAKIGSNRRQERLLAKALQMAEADGAKVDTYDMDVIHPLAGRDVSVSIDGELSAQTADALVEARFISYLSIAPIPPAQIKRMLAEGFNRRVVPHDQSAGWERRPSLFEWLINASAVLVICSAFLALPLLFVFLGVKWLVQLFWRMAPGSVKKLPP